MPAKSILQEWVMELGLRFQGVLLTVIRGCDTAPKQDASKDLTRVLRSDILIPHCGDPFKAKTFIEAVQDSVLVDRFTALVKNLDHYPHHYVMHLVHAIEILGYHHPNSDRRSWYGNFYQRLCRGLHVNPETKEQLEARLGADEETFAKEQ